MLRNPLSFGEREKRGGSPTGAAAEQPDTPAGAWVAFLLSAFWFFFFAAQGLFFSYYSLYLHEEAGLSGSQIGRVWAVVPVVGMAAYPAWGILADRSGERTQVLTGITLMAGLAYGLLGLVESFAGILVATAGLAVFITSVVPIGTSVCMAVLGSDAQQRFGRIRVWGTVGYLLAVTGFPRLLGHPGDGGGKLGSMFPAAALLLAAAGVVALLLPRGGAESLRARAGEWRTLLRHPPMIRALCFGFAAYLFLHGPMLLFPVYIRFRGGDVQTIGDMWVFMLATEIPLLAWMGASLRRFGGRALVAGGVFAGGARWLLCAVVGALPFIYPVQLLHGVVVAGLLIGGPLYIDTVVPERLRSTGQALWAMVGIGIGGGTSALVAGRLADAFGITAPFLLGGVAGALLGLAGPLILAPPRRPAAEPVGGGTRSGP